MRMLVVGNVSRQELEDSLLWTEDGRGEVDRTRNLSWLDETKGPSRLMEA